ncbi:MAG: redox-regulated ATPase YchF, partial [Chloroflexi bacterium]|nr:redox-regulated ATPase YchF [Chloroflexota bacterium]
VDAICLVLCCFSDPDIPHVAAQIDPAMDQEILDLELSLADLASVEKRMEKVRGQAKSGDQELQQEFLLLERVGNSLGQGLPLRLVSLSEEESILLHPLNLFTAKPRIYVANVGEDDLPTGGVRTERVREIGERDGAEVVVLCAKLEGELSSWPANEAQAYRQYLGIKKSGREELIQASYRLLNLISFFTIVGGEEARAWSVVRGTTAPGAGGKVHSDMERGFIRAEVISWSHLLEYGSLIAAREAGAIRSVGREYEVQDGDVIQFRFQG